MKTISLYVEKNTVIHHVVDPFTKLIYLFCSIIAAFTVPTFLGATIMIGVNLFLLAIAKELKRAFKTILGSSLLMVTIFIIQGLFNPHNHTVLWKIGPVSVYREGLMFALTITLRVVNIIAASSLLVLTTSPSSVVEACVRRGLSPKIGYMITTILQIIPMMMSSAKTIQDAQRARGLRMGGNIFRRMKAFMPLIGPITVSSFMSISEKAMALEIRGFSVTAKKTFYSEEKVQKGMGFVQAGLGLATIAIVIWGVVR